MAPGTPALLRELFSRWTRYYAWFWTGVAYFVLLAPLAGAALLLRADPLRLRSPRGGSLWIDRRLRRLSREDLRGQA